jgi:hypothetical protein
VLPGVAIIVAYKNFLDANANGPGREANALAAILRDSAAFPELGGSNVPSASRRPS